MKNEGFTPSNILKHEIKALQLLDWDWKATIIPGRTLFTFFVAC